MRLDFTHLLIRGYIDLNKMQVFNEMLLNFLLMWLMCLWDLLKISIFKNKLFLILLVSLTTSPYNIH